MKLFEYINPKWGKAFKRISDAFHKYSPSWIEWVQREEDCNVLLVHVVGGEEAIILEKVIPKIIIQHCYFSAEYERYDWPKYWEQAILTVSFHNLPEYTERKFSFYGMPWGAEVEQFFRIPSIEKDISIFSTGHVAETECIDKVFEACKTLKTIMFHTGHNFNWNTQYYKHLEYIDNVPFNYLLNRCKYVSALRLVEGFELTAIEGLFCEARPIIPNESTYNWYRNYAYTIDTSKDIVEQLMVILNTSPKPILEEEKKEIISTFSWKTIMEGFYKELETKL